MQPNAAIDQLAKAMQQFYATDKNYFSEIDFTAHNWIKEDALANKHIVQLAQNAAAICEVGCGRANILKHYPQLISKYTGLDFSESIMAENRNAYPRGTFHHFESPEVFPVADASFDLVFCVFVLEHVTRPAAFLNECSRILKPGGKLVILCPDYLGRNRMTSQRSGYSAGTAKAKLQKNKFWDALVTLYDNRIRIPNVCKRFAKQADQSPLFLINCSPIMFADTFFPDADAVYVTYKKEIIDFLSNRFSLIENAAALQQFEKNLKAIFLELVKS